MKRQDALESTLCAKWNSKGSGRPGGATVLVQPLADLSSLRPPTLCSSPAFFAALIWSVRDPGSTPTWVSFPHDSQPTNSLTQQMQ